MSDGFWIEDEDGQLVPVSLLEWARWFDKRDRIVAQTKLGGLRCVSTVFLGLDHNYSDHGPPLLYETLVFPECEYGQRYATRVQALAGHDQVVAALRDGKELCPHCGAIRGSQSLCDSCAERASAERRVAEQGQPPTKQ